MPKPGDQHNQTYPKKFPTFYNIPGHESITEYTEKETAIVQSLLDRQLGPEYISYRPGVNGSKVYYLEGWKVINLANEIFGFNGWSSSIQNIQVDYIEEFKDSGRLNLGVSVIVRVTLKNGIYHEDIGYGCVENFKGKGAAFEKAKKEGTTDALKRALRTFGNVLGNCLYDKTYLKEIGKVHVTESKFNISELYRHPSALNHIPPNNPPKPNGQKEPSNLIQNNQCTTLKNIPASMKESDFYQYGDDFDDIDFQEMDKPIELEFSHQSEFDIEDTFSNFSHSDIVEENAHIAEDMSVLPACPPQNESFKENSLPNISHNPTNQPQKKELENGIKHDNSLNKNSANNIENPANFQQNQTKETPTTHPANQQIHLQNEEHPPDYVPMFVNTRSAFMNGKGTADVSSSIAFNPHTDSPSLRKTPGLDHTKSTPIRRQNGLGSTVPHPTANQTKRTPGTRLVGAPPTNTKHYHPDPFQLSGAKRLANNDNIKRNSSYILNEMSNRVLNQQEQESFQKTNDKKEIHNYDTNISTTAKRYKA
ncbi:uncharacterized protein T551_01250 [Pneumocystis jirovecii RU7]|uniref:DNA repair and recombination protein RAD52 n=1 Tax=Pneumocystis jirovecii (strain RU7) TaxID=1408657 RepID=A0A0W4ZS24_PNEJ7|nr:uncharacterized protein T551_01250 [Pneumocystis jirovecii RU7]KTW31177.1 hypothetical protein T551_01250 [Pneumocystis jirovecii RU7]